MKQADLGAGRPLNNPSRRQLLKGGVAGALLASFGALAAERSVITPGMTYMGGRIVQRVDPTGMPEIRPDAFGPMTFFVFPVAVAVSPMDLYVADAGLSALFRYDAALDSLILLPGVRVSQQTRIAALPDNSVVVVEGSGTVPRRYSRTGRQMQTFGPQNTGARFDDLVVDTVTGRFLGLDRVQRRIEDIQPLGRSASILAEDLLPRQPGAMAVDDRMLYAAGQDCQCIVAVDLQRREKTVLVEDISRVTALAAGEGWLVVSDNVERTLRIYKDQVLRGDPGYDTLRLVNPQGMAIARGTLYVADAGARRIATFRLRP